MKNTLESTLLAKGWLEDENIWNSVKEWDSTIFNGEGDIELFHEICVDYYKKYKSLPDKFVALSEAKKRLKKTYTDTLFKEIYDSEGYKYNEWLKNSLGEYKQSSLLKQFAMNMIDDIDNGEYNIEKWIRAIENTNRKETSKTVKQFSSLGVPWAQKERPQRELLMYPWLCSKTITIITGARGIGKTFFVLGLAKVLSEGGEWGNWQVNDPMNVLYIDGEMAEYDLQERINEMFNQDNKRFYSRSCGEFVEESNVLTDKEFRASILKDCLENEIKVLILDNKSSFTPGLNENDKKDNDEINKWLLDVKHHGVNVIYVTHSGKSRNDPRGTSGITDNVDVVIELSKYDGSVYNECHFKYFFTKIRQRVDKDFVGRGEMRYDNNTWVMGEAKRDEFKARVLKLLYNKTSQADIGVTLGMKTPAVSKYVAKLVKSGDYDKENKRLTDKGHNFLFGE